MKSASFALNIKNLNHDQQSVFPVQKLLIDNDHES